MAGTPFQSIAMDLVGPFEKNAAGFQQILVILDYATRYPEASLLHSTKVTALAPEIMKVFAWEDIPWEIITD